MGAGHAGLLGSARCFRWARLPASRGLQSGAGRALERCALSFWRLPGGQVQPPGLKRVCRTRTKLFLMFRNISFSMHHPRTQLSAGQQPTANPVQHQPASTHTTMKNLLWFTAHCMHLLSFGEPLRLARRMVRLDVLSIGCLTFGAAWAHATPQGVHTRIADEGQLLSLKAKESPATPSVRASRSGPPATAIAAAQPQPVSAPRPMPAAAAWGTPRDSARFFVSGHSLTDDPYASNIADIARSLIGPRAANFNQQISIGSPIRVRTGAPNSFAGYSIGKNRPHGEGLNIRREFASGATINGDRYDTLVITENHNLIQNMQWENTVKQTRHFHEQLIAANPSARTFLHASWWDIDKSKPKAWLDSERALGPMWQCVASRINRSLVAEGRQDRVWLLPTSLALTDLVERALNGQVQGVSAGSPKATLDRIFSDNVHVTPLGMYYLSLVTFSAIYQRSPEGAPPAQGVSQEQASVLQSLAWKFTSDFYSKYQDPSLTECSTRWAPPACVHYWTERKKTGDIQACQAMFQASNKDNPLYYNAQSDAGFWFPSKP